MTSARLSPVWAILAGAAAALPWLWPWASPPVPAAPGLLATWGITALLWLGVRWQEPHAAELPPPSMAALLLLPIIGFAAWRMPVIDLALLGGWGGSLLCIAVAARCLRSAGTPLGLAICWGVLVAACLSSALGLWQYLGLLRAPDAAWTWLHASPHEEAFGQLRQRNQFGSLMSLGLAAWFYLSRVGWPRRKAHGLAWPPLVLLALGAATSSSRTAALAWLILCLLALWHPHPAPPEGEGPTTRQGAVVAILVFLLLSASLPWLTGFLDTATLPKISAFERLATQPEGVGICESRIVLWRHVWELAWQRPWLGWGVGELDFVHATQAVSGKRFCGQLGHAHNLPLHLAVEWGWPLTALICLGALAWVLKHPPWRVSRPIQALGWSWLIVIGLHSALEFPLWYGPFQMVCGFALGAIASDRASASLRSVVSSGPVISLLVGAWFICTLWAGWDYHRVSQVFLPPSQRSPECRHVPANCLTEVVWFHQARDYALLQQAKDKPTSAWGRELAQRVAHFAPEPWVLALLAGTAPPASIGSAQHP